MSLNHWCDRRASSSIFLYYRGCHAVVNPKTQKWLSHLAFLKPLLVIARPKNWLAALRAVNQFLVLKQVFLKPKREEQLKVLPPSRLQQSSIKQATRKKLKALQSNAFNFFLGSSVNHCRFENIQLRSLFAIMQDIKRELKLWLYLLLFKPLKKLKILWRR